MQSHNKPLKLNTSNRSKLGEFQRLFQLHGVKLEASEIELKEIDADPLNVIVHKASQLDQVLVEDTSLDVEGAKVGVHVKWLIDSLDQYLGQNAVWTVYLAWRINEEVFVYEGQVIGIIVSPRGNSGFGFDPYFLPVGSKKTLSEEKPDKLNARSLAVNQFVAGKPFIIRPPFYRWDGPWQ